MFHNTISYIFAFFCLLATANEAAAIGPRFEDPLTFTVTVNKTTTVNLESKIVEQGARPYRWTVEENLPWVIGNNAAGTITFSPTQAGNFTLTTVIVSDRFGEVTDLRRNVSVTVLPAPPEFVSNDVDLGIQKEGVPFSKNIKDFLKDPAAATSFDATGLPPWMSVNKTSGVLSGTAARAHEGNYSGIKLIATGVAGSATTSAHGTVVAVIKPPKWTQTPVTLENVKEGEDAVRETMPYASNPDPDASALEFNIASQTPPPWLQIGKTSGTLFGKAPIPQNVEVSVRLKATIRGQEYTDIALFKFEVIHVNHPPEWKNDPIELPAAFTGVVYNQELKDSFSDPDAGDTHSFSIANGPSWLTINTATGKLSGIPGKSNLGLNTAVVTVKDQAGLSDAAQIKINVIKSNEPPVWNTHPVILADAKEDARYELDLSNYAKDPDSDPLHFTVLSNNNAGWVTVSESGTLAGRPGREHVGMATLEVRVSDKLSTPDDVTQLRILVLPTNHAPEWVLNPIYLSTKEDSAMNLSIAAYAKDKDPNDTLTFSAVSGPAWATLSSQGNFTGTPRKNEVGANEYEVAVSDKAGLIAKAKVIINVEHVNHSPYWVTPIALAEAKEDEPYSVTLKPFAKDDDPGDEAQLRFLKISSAPQWLTLSSDGTLAGTPGKNEAEKTFSFEVRVLDPSQADAITTVSVKVKKTNHPPIWRENPVPLTDAREDRSYTFALSIYAADPDGDPLSFKKVSGPEWMFVGTAGDITGTPAKKDLGTHPVVLEVNDGEFAVRANANITVIHTNHAPVIPVLSFEMKEREVFSQDLKKLVTDADEDALNFALLSPPSWMTLTAEGLFEAKPMAPQIGNHTVNLRVDDKQEPVFGEIKIKVLRNPRPPRWLQDPMAMEAETNTPFSASLGDKAKDDDNLPLTFSKVDGPAWLTVAANGGLTGTPLEANVGNNVVKVRVCNTDPLCADATLNINVKIAVKVVTVDLQTPVPGAKTEQLWVVDNSDSCDPTIRSLKKNIGVFTAELGDIHHQGILISSDAKEFDGQPIHSPKEKMLLSWNDADWLGSFRRRLDLAYSGGGCNNCNNSPIYSMYRFYEQLPNISEIYHQGYSMPGVPSDVLIVTHQRDYYKHYTKKIPVLKDYTAAEFVRDYKTFHRKEEKTLRISAIAPACAGSPQNPVLYANGDPKEVAPENAYRVLVEATKGKYFSTGCSLDMAATLKKYAAQVKFTANVHAKQRIPLDPRPLSASSIKVWVGSVELPPQTDKWIYDSAHQEIWLRWDLIDEGQLKPGDTLRIEYRIS